MKLRQSFLLFILFNIYTSINYAQSNYAKHIVDTLSSSAFWGRGYTKMGMNLSAKFIGNEMLKIGLKPHPTLGMYQSFTIPVNTFPGKMDLEINGKKLIPGKDFLIDAASKGIKGNFTLLPTTENGVYYNLQNAIAVIYNEKLVWSPSSVESDDTRFIVKEQYKTDKLRIKANIQQQFIQSFEAINVLGMVPGTEYSDSFLVLTAHYDHLGGMGNDVFFPGANDNASGLALLLEMAKYYAKNPAKYTVLFIAFAAEEIGLKGSSFFVEHTLIDLNKIKFLLNLDLMGNGEQGITVVNATSHLHLFEKLKKWNENSKSFISINQRDNASNSDHYPFTQKGVPSFFIYTLGGNQAYHDIYDIPKTLSLAYFPSLENMIIHFFNTINE